MTRQTKISESGAKLVRYVNANDPKDVRNACWYASEAAAQKSYYRRNPS